MEHNIAEEAMMPVTNKLVALAQLFDCGAFAPKGLDEGGFIGVSARFESIGKHANAFLKIVGNALALAFAFIHFPLFASPAIIKGLLLPFDPYPADLTLVGAGLAGELVHRIGNLTDIKALEAGLQMVFLDIITCQHGGTYGKSS